MYRVRIFAHKSYQLLRAYQERRIGKRSCHSASYRYFLTDFLYRPRDGFQVLRQLAVTPGAVAYVPLVKLPPGANVIYRPGAK